LQGSAARESPRLRAWPRLLPVGSRRREYAAQATDRQAQSGNPTHPRRPTQQKRKMAQGPMTYFRHTRPPAPLWTIAAKPSLVPPAALIRLFR
jgi:hypothetical protein